MFINPTISCGECYACKELGQENICDKIAFLGLSAHTGAFAEVMNFSARRGLLLPPDLSTDLAAVLEPITVAKHAARKAGVTAKDSVLIVGAGPVGLGMLLVCKQLGVRKVIVSEISAKRTILARDFGADVILDPKKDDVVAITRREFDGIGAQFAFDISGNEASLDTAIKSIRIQGTVVVVAVFAHPARFNPNDLLLAEKKIMSSLAYSEEDLKEVIRVFGGQPEWRKKVACMISLKVGLTDAVSRGFDALINHKEEHVKVLITAQSSIMV